MKKKIAVLPGDGIGPEVIREGINVLKKIAGKFGHQFFFNEGLIGADAIDRTGSPLPEETLNLCRKADAVLFGAIGNPKYDLDPKAKIRPEQGLLKLRKSLGLYANLRPVIIYRELADASPLKKEIISAVDLMMVRELTGGIYFGEPRLRKNNGETAVDTSVYTRSEIMRIAKIAFEIARKRSKKIASVDKANVLETSRLWRETVTEVSRIYPDIELAHLFVDSASMQLIKKPSEFDVILTENMFGDILSDEISVIAGSIGLLPSASIGTNICLYEPVHGSYPKAAGKDTANPLATVLSAAMMLRISFGMEKEAQTVEKAVEKFIKIGYRTEDLKTPHTPKNKILGTEETGEKIAGLI